MLGHDLYSVMADSKPAVTNFGNCGCMDESPSGSNRRHVRTEADGGRTDALEAAAGGSLLLHALADVRRNHGEQKEVSLPFKPSFCLLPRCLHCLIQAEGILVF